MSEKCPICDSPAIRTCSNNKIDLPLYNCCRCGNFTIDSLLESEIMTLKHHKQSAQMNYIKISSWLRENQGALITRERITDVSKHPFPSVGERAVKLLVYLSNNFTFAGQQINLSFQDLHILMNMMDIKPLEIDDLLKHYLGLFSISWSESVEEIEYLIRDFLIVEKHFLEPFSSEGNTRITPAGWAFLESLGRSKDSNLVFLALQFDKKIKEFNEKWVEPAVRNAGYRPKRLDKYESLDLIDDQMLALIRQSKFMVSDFTENNSGVYFETGFAMGLNISVFYICEKSYFEKIRVHFDTSHYPHLLYEAEKGEDFSRQLQYRIEATMGKGNFISNIS